MIGRQLVYIWEDYEFMKDIDLNIKSTSFINL